MKLSARLALVFTTFAFVLISSVAAVSWLLAAREARQSVDNDLITRGKVIENIGQVDIGRVLEVGRGTPVPLDAAIGGDDLGIQFVNQSGEPVGNEALLLPVDQQAASGLTSLRTETVGNQTYRVYSVPLPDDLVQRPDLAGLQLFRNITAEETAIDVLALQLLALSAGGMALAAVGSWLVGRWLAEPVRRVTSAAEQLADLGSSPGRIEVSRADEIGSLANSFNRMAAALEIGREQQQRLVADASHELRTPLTSLRMRVDFLASFDDPPGDYESIVQGAVVDLEQLTALVTDLVDLASDARSADEGPETLRLKEIASVVANRTSIAAGRPISIEADDSVALVYPTMIRRALQNLVDNALKYGPDAGEITIKVANNQIEVLDEGTGIAPEDIDHVFDRFFRSPKARSRPGNGIGLAIVKQVADVHNGTVWARDTDAGGAQIGFSVASKTLQ